MEGVNAVIAFTAKGIQFRSSPAIGYFIFLTFNNKKAPYRRMWPLLKRWKCEQLMNIFSYRLREYNCVRFLPHIVSASDIYLFIYLFIHLFVYENEVLVAWFLIWVFQRKKTGFQYTVSYLCFVGGHFFFQLLGFCWFWSRTCLTLKIYDCSYRSYYHVFLVLCITLELF